MRLIHRSSVRPRSGGLCRFVECLKVEDVDAPVQCRADSGLVEGLGVVGPGDRGRVVGSTFYLVMSVELQRSERVVRTIGGPPSLSIPQLHVRVARNILYVGHCLEHVVQIRMRCIVNLLSLPK